MSNSLLGIAFLGERPNRLKTIAIAVSFGGIVAVFSVIGILPLISLCIALSFGVYGVLEWLPMEAPLPHTLFSQGL